MVNINSQNLTKRKYLEQEDKQHYMTKLLEYQILFILPDYPKTLSIIVTNPKILLTNN